MLEGLESQGSAVWGREESGGRVNLRAPGNRHYGDNLMNSLPQSMSVVVGRVGGYDGLEALR